jgi:ammonia channel protein AmtB
MNAVFAQFQEQQTTEIHLTDVFYMVVTAMVMLAVVGLALFDIGLVRSKNFIDTVLQKMVAGVIATAGWLIVGFAVWNWQTNQAFGVPNPLGESVKAWWFGGSATTTLAQFIDPAVIPSAEVSQIYNYVFVGFAFFVGAVIHSIGLEKIKPVATYVMSFVFGGIVLPIMIYLLWGSSGVLTNHGIHDVVGGIALYIPLGVTAFIVAKVAGPRLGLFAAHRSADPPSPSSLPLVGIGVMLILASLPFFAAGAGILIPGVGYVGVSMTTTTLGAVFASVFIAYVGGGLAGAIISYRTRNPLWAIAGSFIGYVSGTSIFDTASPWTMLIVAFMAPFVAYVVYGLMIRLRIDEGKYVPLLLAPAIYGAVVGGFTEWHERAGGYIGITEGKYAFQHAEITPWWQLLAIGVAIAGTVLIMGIVVWALKATGNLRVSEAEEIAGLDATYWTPRKVALPTGGVDGDVLLGELGKHEGAPA